MSTQEHLVIARSIYTNFGQGNIPGILDVMTEDVELHEPPGGEPPFAGTYYGRDGASRFFQEMIAAVEVLMLEPYEFVAQGDTVVVLGHYRFRSRASGIAYDTDWAMVWWFRDGKVAKFQIHDDSATESAALRGVTASTEQNKATARRWFSDIITRGQLDVADEIFAANHVIHDPHAPPTGWPNGPQGLKMVATVFGGGFSDWWIRIEDQIAEGNTVATRWAASATNTGPVMGMPSTGKTVQVTGVNVARFADGKIAESWFNFDMLSLLQQLGVIPTPEEVAQ